MLWDDCGIRKYVRSGREIFGFYPVFSLYLQNRKDAWSLEVRCNRKAGAASPAGDAHMAGKRRLVVAPVDDEIMALGLARDRFVDRGIEEFVGF
jgi:hypothetical protein